MASAICNFSAIAKINVCFCWICMWVCVRVYQVSRSGSAGVHTGIKMSNNVSSSSVSEVNGLTDNRWGTRRTFKYKTLNLSAGQVEMGLHKNEEGTVGINGCTFWFVSLIWQKKRALICAFLTHQVKEVSHDGAKYYPITSKIWIKKILTK